MDPIKHGVNYGLISSFGIFLFFQTSLANSTTTSSESEKTRLLIENKKSNGARKEPWRKPRSKNLTRTKDTRSCTHAQSVTTG